MENIDLPTCQAEVQKYKNVLGSGLGYKWVDGLPTKEPAIIVFVEQKMDLENEFFAQAANTLIPEEINGIKTDIISVGRLERHAEIKLDTNVQEFRKRTRPIIPGYSVGHGEITAGTIGGFFIDKDDDLVILSNSHVLANEGRAQFGDVIFQPGPSDGNPPKPFDGWSSPVVELPYIASLKNFIKYSDSNTQDSAIAKIPKELISAGLISPIYPRMNKPISGIVDPTVGLNLQKVGRTTGYTVGTVLAVGASFTIQYESGLVKFDNVIVTSAMSAPGDSGSLVFDTNMNMVGLLFAGSLKVSLLNPIKPVLDYYGLQPYRGGPIVRSFSVGDDWSTSSNQENVIEKNGGNIRIKTNASDYAYVEKLVEGITEFSAKINTGDDKGFINGPGIAVVYPEGMVRLYLRHNCCYGFTMNTRTGDGLSVKDYANIGRPKENTDYILKITDKDDKIIGTITYNDTVTEVFNVPKSVFPSKAMKLRAGKIGIKGGAQNQDEPNAEIGSCTISDLNAV